MENKKMQSCLKRVEDPAKVAAIQKFFGVTYNKRAPIKSDLENEYTKEQSMSMVRKKSTTNSSDFSRTETEPADVEVKNYTVKNQLWYYFFIAVTYLGDVIGYALILPFLFWNVDGTIARKLVLVWTVIMYVGQAAKEVFCRGRPKSPPVIRLQKRWSEEYGMPSTHAMASVALSGSLMFYGLQRYKFSLPVGVGILLIWCFTISFSRLYLGMHSILDIIAGFVLSSLLLIPLLPMMNLIDNELIENSYSPFVIFLLSLLCIKVYPKSRGPSTAQTKTDTAIILATCVGIEIGCWLNFKLHVVQKSTLEIPYLINVPDGKTWVLITCRTILGLFCIVISFLFFELVMKFTYWVLYKIKVSHKEIGGNNKKIPFLDLCFKYLTYCFTSIHVTFSIPLLFKFLNIHRSSYFTE